MKSILFLLVSLLCLSSINSQEYTNPENVWIYSYLGVEERYFVQTWGEDTMINGEEVKTLERQGYQVFRDINTGEISNIYGPYDGGEINIKMVDGEVYIYNMNRDSFEFVFDFNAEVGDTWDLKTYYDYDCNEMEPFHIAFTNIVDEINMIEGVQNPIEVLSMKTVYDNGSSGSAWFNPRIYKNIGPSTYYTICVEPLDIIDLYPEYDNVCYSDYCFHTIANLSYFGDEIGAHLDYLDEEILNEMLSVHNQTQPQLELKLSPNPVSDMLNIQTNYHITHTMIYNAEGKQVFEQKRDATQINVSSLSQGVYLVVVKTDEGIEGTKKFIKK